MKAYYSARAPEYDRVYAKPERQGDLRSIEQWLPQKFAQRQILEVACGTGYWTQFVAPVATSVVALDSSPESLEIARRRVNGHVTFVVDDAYELTCVGSGFNAAFAGFWFSHIPLSVRRCFLIRLQRVLEPFAKVVLLDNRFVAGSSSPVCRTDADGNTFQSRHLQEGSVHEVLKNFPTERELLNLVAGLSVNPQVTVWQYFWALEYEVPLQPAQ
jgi:demethylmenaquinone methyltransferase/2-methoxy-6-polyprenyl-1,4-benzoquinol methylase